jgi:hypothetical protein
VTLPDGTRLDQRTTARYYRNRAGQARIELRTDSLDVPKTVSERHIRTIVAPDGKDGVFTLDPVTRTTRYLPRSWLAYVAGGEGTDATALDWLASGPKVGGLTFAVPIPGASINDVNMPFRFLVFRRAQDFLASNTATMATDVRDESLGSRRVGDLETTGRRVTMTIPTTELRNDRPFQMVDERWEAADLKLLVSARVSDSRMGDVEYQLTHISRAEPPADLFVVPPDYRIDTTATPHETWIALIYADRYPTVGVAYAKTLDPH